jgi:protein gp37
MGEKTGISWTDATWNCWQGCHKVSAGCKNCYMFSEKTRYGQNPNVVIRSSDTTFNAPLKWAKNPAKYGHIKRVFVDSWSDFFIEEADPWRAEAWEIMRNTPQFIYQLCTKRPERIAKCLPPDWEQGYPNVWLLTSTENQAAADLRIPILLSIPAIVHGISAEPLLGPIDLQYPKSIWPNGPAMCCSGFECGCQGLPIDPPLMWGLEWVIVGGESGTNARPMISTWADDIRRQCEASRVAFFFKQNGEWIDAGHREFGKHPSVPHKFLRFDGTEWPLGAAELENEDADVNTLVRVGRQTTADTLYGKVYHAFPEVSA